MNWQYKTSARGQLSVRVMRWEYVLCEMILNYSGAADMSQEAALYTDSLSHPEKQMLSLPILDWNWEQ